MSDEEAGYCKPPKHTRFEKGFSGNPKGRPKGRKNFATTLGEILDERVPINENGKRAKKPKSEVIARQIVNKAAGGDPKMIPIALQHLAALEAKSESGGNPALFTEADRIVIATLHQRLKLYLGSAS